MNEAYHLGAAADLTPDPERLHDSPSWVYLLREFEKHYRLGSDGGSKAIRAHRKRVRDTLSGIIDANTDVCARCFRAATVRQRRGEADADRSGSG